VAGSGIASQVVVPLTIGSTTRAVLQVGFQLAFYVGFQIVAAMAIGLMIDSSVSSTSLYPNQHSMLTYWFSSATLIGGGPSFVKSLSGGVNTRAAWEEAEIFLFNKLRSGMHSDEIEERVRQELSRTFQSGYRYAFLRAILSQLVKLRGSRTIRDMPSMSVQLQMARVDHLRFLLGLRNRFTDITSFRCYTVDDEATREFGKLNCATKQLKSFNLTSAQQHVLGLLIERQRRNCDSCARENILRWRSNIEVYPLSNMHS
jgi:hypothetical protein